MSVTSGPRRPATEVAASVGVELGVYEKALRWEGSWEALFASAARAGFRFVDLSIDESDARLARLDWTPAERCAVRAAASAHGVALGGLCLSAHRRIAPGSADPEIRERAREILVGGIDLCVDLGIPVLQLAGYFAYYEPRTAGSRARYLEVLADGARHAARAGVMLGLENVDGEDVCSVRAALRVVEEIGSAWFALYPDIGNLAETGNDVIGELALASGRMVALHVKDVRPGEPRRVAMGQGMVDWPTAFAELARQRWCGRMLIEMWNDDAPDSEQRVVAARTFVSEHLRAAGIPVVDESEGSSAC